MQEMCVILFCKMWTKNINSSHFLEQIFLGIFDVFALKCNYFFSNGFNLYIFWCQSTGIQELYLERPLLVENLFLQSAWVEKS